MNSDEILNLFMKKASNFLVPFSYSCGFDCCGTQGVEWRFPEERKRPGAEFICLWARYLRACKSEGKAPGDLFQAYLSY